MASKWYMGLDLQSQKLINVADPTNAQDGSTKAYTDLWKTQQQVLSTPSSSITSSTLVSVLSVTLTTTGTYTFWASVGLVGNGTTSTPGINIGGTMVTSQYRFMVNFASNNLIGANVSTNQAGTTLSSTGLALGALGTNTSQQGLVMSGMFTVGTAGTATIAMSVTAGTGQFTARTGSGLYVTRTA